MTTRLACAAVAAVLLSGCGTARSKEPQITPDQARERLSATIREVLEAGVPGGAPELDSSGLNNGIPCGGLEGNQFNKIKHAINATTSEASRDPDTAIVHMQAKLDELGYRNGVTPDDGFQMIGFHDSHGGGDIQVYATGDITVDAETKCLDNPDE